MPKIQHSDDQLSNKVKKKKILYNLLFIDDINLLNLLLKSLQIMEVVHVLASCSFNNRFIKY